MSPKGHCTDWPQSVYPLLSHRWSTEIMHIPNNNHAKLRTTDCLVTKNNTTTLEGGGTLSSHSVCNRMLDNTSKCMKRAFYRAFCLVAIV